MAQELMMKLRRLLGERPTLRLAKWAGLSRSAAKSKSVLPFVAGSASVVRPSV
jgi:hypothetical protein